MKKNYLYLILLLLSNLLAIGQKVTLIPTTVNGVSTSAGPINLGSTAISKITLATEVTLSTPKSNTDPGNIKIYYQKSSTSPSNVTDGGNGGSLLFNGGTSATRSFSITLNLSDFDLTGGNIYAEYKTPAGTAYKSTPISVIKNANTPTFPSYPTETKIEAVPYDATPLLPEFINYPIEYYSEVESQNWYNTSDINTAISTLNINNSPGYNLIQKTIFKDGSFILSKKIQVEYRKFLSTYENLSVDNRISSNQYITNEQTPKTIIGNQASETHGFSRRGNSTIKTLLTNYQWQTRISFPVTWTFFADNYINKYGWMDIPGATEANYTPPKTTKATEYRRLVIEPGSSWSPDIRRSAASNVIKILPITIDPTKNTICCDQTMSTSRENLKPIIGDWKTNGPYYQWQFSEDEINWEYITDTNKKDYTPSSFSRSRNTNTTHFYRRIINDLTTSNCYISNTTKIILNLAPRVYSSVIIYPNPTSAILNIESINEDLNNAKLTITNIIGNNFVPNSTSIVNSHLITLNISNLNTGTYFINIEVLQNNRRNAHQLTFIKQ